MKALFVVLACVALAGCTTLTSEVMLPNNQKGYSINCGGLGISYCLNRASELCPAGYSLVGNQNSTGYIVQSAIAMPIQQTEILARCN